MEKSEIYYAYGFIQASISTPFRTLHPATLFNVAKFLFTRLSRLTDSLHPKGVKLANILQVLATSAENMGAFKLARTAYQKLQSLYLPISWKRKVDLRTVLIRAKPFLDREDLLPVCYRCGTTNPLISNRVRTSLTANQKERLQYFKYKC